MKIIVAFDSFKGTLSAQEACGCVHEALNSVKPNWNIVRKPMADGGEGTADAMIAARDGTWISHPVMGPLPNMSVTAGYAWFEKPRDALVEMAAASGLPLLQKHQLNPLNTTTFGTGELMAAAMKKNPTKIWLAVGGSATVDGGVGAAMALDWKFLDKNNKPVGLGGGELERIEKIIPPSDLSFFPPVSVLCDVTNPLCGPEGAARVFGPQKGATSAMIEALDRGLQHLAQKVKEQLGKDILSLPGGGAAGGLAAGAIAFFNAELVSGIDTIMDISGLDRELADADWIITGEGRFDEQSLHGKVVSGIVKKAKAHDVRVAVIAGQVQMAEQRYKQFGIDVALSTAPPDMPIETALSKSKELLYAAALTFANAN